MLVAGLDGSGYSVVKAPADIAGVSPGGTLTITHSLEPPADYGWHQMPGAAMLMRRIKDQFDPDRIFGDGPQPCPA